MTRPTLPIALAAQAITQGEVVAYPTEAVWGLGCDPYNQGAVNQLLAIKHRPVEKGLILVVANPQQIFPFLDQQALTAEQLSRLQTPTAQPTTWLVPVKPGCLPSWVTGRFSTVAVRISQHPTVQALSLAADLPLVSTSANPAGCLPAKEIFQIKRYFGDSLPVCRGRIGAATQPSTIRDLISGTTIRE